MDREPGGSTERPTVMRTRVAPLAAVVAFALIVATVAALAGRGGDGQDLIKLPLGSSAGSSAPGAEDAAASTASRAMLAPGFGRIEYEVAGTLPELPSTAPAYRLGSRATEADVRGLAEALGLDGPVVEKDAAWVVTAGGKELRVAQVPGLPWYMGPSCPEQPVSSDGPTDLAARLCDQGVAVASGSGVAPAPPAPAPAPAVAAPVCRPTPTGESCSVAGAGVPEPAVLPPVTATADCPPGTADCAPSRPAPPAVAPPTSAPLPPPEAPARPAGLPTRQEAERGARALLERLNASTEGLKVEDGWATWEAWVEPRLDGFRVFGPGHSVSIGPRGEVVRASGALARPERIGDYPLVGMAEGLERLKDPEALFGPSPAAAVQAFAATGQEIAPPTTAVGGGASAGSAGSAGSTVVTAGIPADEAAKLEAERRAAADVDCGDPTVRCEPALPPDAPPAPPVPAEPIVQTITGARLALMHIDAVLVPVYVFELEGGGETFPVPAVTGEWLQQQAPSVVANKD